MLTIFIMAFVDTMGTLIGLSARAGFLDENGQLPQIERPMLVDAVTTCVAPALGTTTAGAYVESATGIEAGGRTGLTVLVTGTCFLLTLFFSPFVAAIPAQAFGPALIIVGLFMLAPITRIDFGDYTESVPAFAVVVSDGIHLQHRHRNLRGFRALSNLQDGCRKATPAETRTLGADRTLAAILHLLSLRLIHEEVACQTTP